MSYGLLLNEKDEEFRAMAKDELANLQEAIVQLEDDFNVRLILNQQIIKREKKDLNSLD